MFNIQLDAHTRITTDKNNYIISEETKDKKTKKYTGKYTEKYFYRYFTHLLRNYANRKLRASNAKTIDDAINQIEAVHEKIEIVGRGLNDSVGNMGLLMASMENKIAYLERENRKLKEGA